MPIKPTGKADKVIKQQEIAQEDIDFDAAILMSEHPTPPKKSTKRVGRPRTNDNLIRMEIKITLELKEAIVELAKEQNRTVTNMIGQMLQEYISQTKSPRN